MGIYSAVMVTTPVLIDWTAYDILVILYYATKDVKEQFIQSFINSFNNSYTDRKVRKSNLCSTSDEQKKCFKITFQYLSLKFSTRVNTQTEGIKPETRV